MSAQLWTGRFLAMTIKELRQFWRDRPVVIFLLYAFTAQIYLAGTGVQLTLHNAPWVLLDQDKSQLSRDLPQRFTQPAFRYLGEVSSKEQGLELLQAGKAMGMVLTPPDFQESIQSCEQVEIQLLVDMTNTMVGGLFAGHSRNILVELGRQVSRDAGCGLQLQQRPPGVTLHARTWYNPNRDERWFMSVAELLNIITLFAILLPTMAMVREREKETVEQLLVAPLTPLQVMLPKVLAMCLVILCGVIASLYGIMQLVLDVPVRGNHLLFLFSTALYTGAMAGLGLLLATVARNMGQASMLAILVFAPVIFLSGMWTPPEAMPDFMRPFLDFSPLHHYINLSFGILLKGAHLGMLWQELAWLLGLGTLAFGLGLWRLGRSL